jgi:hypothetical protein
MGSGTFATAIDCIDGRTKQAVTAWIQQNAHVAYVDLVTIPGPDKAMSDRAVIQQIKERAQISVTAHHSAFIAIAGHAECAGNPVSEQQHREEILAAMRTIASWNWPVEVAGLWVNASWQVEVLGRMPAPSRAM